MNSRQIVSGLIAVVEFALILTAIALGVVGEFGWAGISIGIAIWLEVGER